jgi:hypothetical protein
MRRWNGPIWILRGRRVNSSRTGLPRNTPLPSNGRETLEGRGDAFRPAEQFPVVKPERRSVPKGGSGSSSGTRPARPSRSCRIRRRRRGRLSRQRIRNDRIKAGAEEPDRSFPSPRPFSPSTRRGRSGRPGGPSARVPPSGGSRLR